MRTPKEIKKEVAALKKLLAKKDRWNSKARACLEAQLEVISSPLSEMEIERRWWEDETSEEFRDGDNEVYHEAMAAKRWKNGENEDSPSKVD